MVSLELTENEMLLVHEILEEYLADLRMEVAATDSKGVRDILKVKEISLKGVLSRFSGAAAA